MRVSYEFRALLGTVFSGGNVLFTRDGNTLLSPTGNRVTVFDLVRHETYCLPFECRMNVARLVLSPDNRLLLAIDVEGRAVLVNLHHRVALCHFNFQKPVAACEFSPDGKFLAVAVGKHVQVWRAPSTRKELTPFVKLRTYTGHYSDVTCIAWSPDSQFFASGGKDMFCRVFSLHPRIDYVPFALSGHRDALVMCAFAVDGKQILSLSRDGALLVWEWDVTAGAQPIRSKAFALKQQRRRLGRSSGDNDDGAATAAAAAADDDDDDDDGSGSGGSSGDEDGAKLRERGDESDDADAGAVAAEFRKQEKLPALSGRWKLARKVLLNERSSRKVQCATYNARAQLLVVGFQNGVFILYEMPQANEIHQLSIGGQRIDTCALSASTDWIAFGSAKLGQLLVWEWKSETYVLKQQGHYYDLTCAVYSPDGKTIATGGDDGKLKLWSTSTGFCFVTFSDHTAPITGAAYVSNGSAVVSSSLDGTVRAFDTLRYRNFRTFTSPEPVQFTCVCVDPSGEVVCAGSQDPFHVFVWSMQNGQLLEVLSGHEGPIASLAFSPTRAVLCSGSWDRTMKLWDVFESKGNIQTLECATDVQCVAFSPDGKRTCGAALDGHLYFWKVADGTLEFSIDCKRDVGGGRLVSDRRTAANSASNKHFDALCFSSDGEYLLASGPSKFVCMYSLTSRVLVKRFQISRNLSLDGMLAKLNSRDMTEAGPAALIDVDSDDDSLQRVERLNAVPGARRGDLADRRVKRAIRVSAVQFDPTNRAFAVASTEGLMLYAVDDVSTFDPFELDLDISPAAVEAALAERRYAAAVMMSLRLGELAVVERVLDAIPSLEIQLVVHNVAVPYLQKLLALLASCTGASPRLEFYLRWILEVLSFRGRYLQENSSGFVHILRAVQKSINRVGDVLKDLAFANRYGLRYMTQAAALLARAHAGADAGVGESDGDVGEAVARSQPESGSAAASGAALSDVLERIAASSRPAASTKKARRDKKKAAESPAAPSSLSQPAAPSSGGKTKASKKRTSAEPAAPPPATPAAPPSGGKAKTSKKRTSAESAALSSASKKRSGRA